MHAEPKCCGSETKVLDPVPYPTLDPYQKLAKTSFLY
jgi:hypothetical protein